MKQSAQSRWLRFDRMLVGSLWKQVRWIICILIGIWVLSYACLSLSGTEWEIFCRKNDIKPWLLPLYLLIDTNALNNLYLTRDPANAHAFHGWLLIVSSITYLIGLLIFNGIIISVLSNWIAQRKEDYNNGVARYRHSGHYIIMGYDEMVPSVIAHIFRHDTQAKIILLSAAPSVKIRERLRKSVKSEYFDQIVVCYGHRIANEYYSDIQLDLAKEIYIVGKRTLSNYDSGSRILSNHDAVNVECVENILDYLSSPTVTHHPQRITCVFEDFDTYSAFKIVDIFEKAKALHIDFVPYNYYIGWAKQVLVARRYFSTFGERRYEYPAVYRKGIGYNDPHFVHLVFVGTSTFAVAFANEAAHLLHFPNGTTYSPDQKKKRQQIRTRITFIDLKADSEMNLFRTRNRHFFEVQSCTYWDLTKKDNLPESIEPTLFKGKNADFLDIDFEFIKGDVFSPEVQQVINDWASDSNRYLSIFLALANQRDNFTMAMNMPETVYNKEVPVFIRQDYADSFVTKLKEAHTVTPSEDGSIDKKEAFYTFPDPKDPNNVKKTRRVQRYANLYPFGMYETAFYYDDTDTARAQLYNYLYATADYPAYKFTDKLVLAAMSDDRIMREAQTFWQELKVALKWSNLYAVESFSCKQASVNAMKMEEHPLTEEQLKECMAHVEHNRWNVEKLLMGYRKAQADEEKYAVKTNDDEAKKMREKLASNKKFHFAHSDIRPFDQLDDIRKLDEEFTQYIPWIISIIPD